VILTFRELWSHVTGSWGEIQKSGFEKLYTRSRTIVITHQLWAPRQNKEEVRRRKVQFSEIQKVSDLDLDLDPESGQADISTRARPCDSSLREYGNMVIWNSCSIDVPRSLNSRDSFRKMKFENRAPTSCRIGPVLSWSTISFELHAKICRRRQT